MWPEIAQHISRVTRSPFEIQQRRSVGGGSINQAYQISGFNRSYFLKTNQASQLAMFEQEALGLKEIADSKTVLAPRPLGCGVAGNVAYIVMNWIELGGGGNAAWEAMGHSLAAMHRVTSAQGFGWHQDNTIGATPQKNPWTADWAEFFRDHRLAYQFRLAQRRGGSFPQQDELLAAVPQLLAGHYPEPALVHGDLWSGNAAISAEGEPVLLDPAVYYGDREVDLGMTEVFGGFPAAFYRGYNDAYPLDKGYEQRKVLYNLYHILNHFNLFGGGYQSQAQRMIARLLS